MNLESINILHKEKIKPSTFSIWLETYSATSLREELLAASSYLADSGKTYKNYQRFYGNWLRRSATKKVFYDKTTIDTFFDKIGSDGWPETLP